MSWCVSGQLTSRPTFLWPLYQNLFPLHRIWYKMFCLDLDIHWYLLCVVIANHIRLAPLFLCSWLAQSSAVRARRSMRSGKCRELRSRSGASWTGQATAMSPSQEHQSASTWPSISSPLGKKKTSVQPKIIWKGQRSSVNSYFGLVNVSIFVLESQKRQIFIFWIY